MVQLRFPKDLRTWIDDLAGWLQVRSAPRLPALLLGMLFAQGRRTVASWLRAGGLGYDFRAFYYFLGSLGRCCQGVATKLLLLVLERVLTGARLLFVLDDTPTKRAGPMVEGAGIHHNPTPGPADQTFLYGHVWVTLALVVRHPEWGAIALPLLAWLYVRQANLGFLSFWYGIPFRTKLELAIDLLAWLKPWLSRLGKEIWVVADGAYGKRPLLKWIRNAGFVLVSRLRHDAALRSLPEKPAPDMPRRRGRPAKYGREKISLAKRAGQRRGWLTEEFVLYGRKVRKTYKTFLATYRPAYGTIRVVLVQEESGWAAFFATKEDATVADILEAVSDRAAIEQVFHDVKEVHGAGQQQLRNYWANIAAFNLNLWLHTLIELWAWAKPAEELSDRSASPWDDPDRRPSHADRRKALQRTMLEEEYRAAARRGRPTRKMRELFCRLIGRRVA